MLVGILGKCLVISQLCDIDYVIVFVSDMMLYKVTALQNCLPMAEMLGTGTTIAITSSDLVSI